MATVEYWTWPSRVRFTGVQYLDEPDEHISAQEIEVSVPTRKRRISDDLSEEDSNSVSLVKKSWEEVRLIMKKKKKKKTDQSQRIN